MINERKDKKWEGGRVCNDKERIQMVVWMQKREEPTEREKVVQGAITEEGRKMENNYALLTY